MNATCTRNNTTKGSLSNMLWVPLVTENIVQKMRASESQNKTKHLGRFSPLLPRPNKELLHLRFQQRRKKLCNLILPHCFLVWTEQEALPPPIFVRLWGGRTDWGCLQLAAAGTTPTQTLRGLVCCVFALCTLRLGKTSRSDSHLLRLSLVIFVLFV